MTLSGEDVTVTQRTNKGTVKKKKNLSMFTSIEFIKFAFNFFPRLGPRPTCDRCFVVDKIT
jgi:hypothetical protein